MVKVMILLRVHELKMENMKMGRWKEEGRVTR